MISADLKGKTALITGASSGFGAHFAKVLARNGARVMLAARRLGELQAVVTSITAQGGEARALPLDVIDPASIDGLLTEIAPPDVLVNNAGVAGMEWALDQRTDHWDRVLDTNLRGAFLVAVATARRMRERFCGGSIINIASILGLRQAGKVVSYAVSKAGMIQMTKSLALEWARYNIRVNALAPGYFDTELNRAFWASSAGKALISRVPQRRLGQLEDLDGALLLLASDSSRFMTGSVVAVDGGHLVSSL